jgi:two-component system response regulator CpxR
MEQKNLKILIADDEKELLDVLRELLELDGHNVTVAYDGEKALQICKENKFDIVFADISMPGMDGIDLTKELLVLDKEAKVAVITGLIGTVEVKLALSAGAKGFLKKPFTKRELDQTIKEILKIG